MDMNWLGVIAIVLMFINMGWVKLRYKNKRRTFVQGWYIGMVLILLVFGFLIFKESCFSFFWPL
jgi:hypothetical protein